jgi:hypothetical protein
MHAADIRLGTIVVCPPDLISRVFRQSPDPEHMERQMSIQDTTTEVYGSRTLYGAIVAGAAFLVIASFASFGPTPAASTQHVAKTPTTVETIVVTPGHST